MVEKKKTRHPVWPWVLGASICFFAGLAGGASVRWFEPSSFTVSYVDFISIILTALGVLITVLGIFIAILSIIGWRSIEDKLRDHSFDYVGSQLKEGQPLYDLIMRAVREAAYQGVREEDPDKPFEDPEEPQV